MNVGIIGGSGLYEWSELTDVEWLEVDTPYGPPSDLVMRGAWAGHTVYFIPRHGRGHRLLPSEINHRANLFAFKRLGVEQILSVSAVGSLQEHIHPRDIVIPDQYFDLRRYSAGLDYYVTRNIKAGYTFSSSESVYRFISGDDPGRKDIIEQSDLRLGFRVSGNMELGVQYTQYNGRSSFLEFTRAFHSIGGYINHEF